MVRITPWISVVIQRRAVKNQQLLEKWIAENSFISYDEYLVCMTIAMNPCDAKSAVENLNNRLNYYEKIVYSIRKTMDISRQIDELIMDQRR